MSVKLRITLVTALFLTCTSVAVSVFALRAQRAHLHAESRRKIELALSMLADMSTPLLLQGDSLALAGIADRVAAGQPERVYIADRRGVVLADSAHELYDTSAAAVRTIKQRGRRHIVRKGSVWEGAASARDYQGRVAGIVVVSFSARPLDAALSHVTRTVTLFAVVSIVLGALVATALGRYLSAALDPLLTGIRKTAGGDFASRIPGTGMIELDEIGRAFNRMASLVGRQVHDLSALNELSARLTAARTTDHFADVLAHGCRSLVDGSTLLLYGDPRTGSLEFAGCEERTRRVSPTSAAFIAVNERRAVVIGGDSGLPPGYEVVSGIKTDSGVVAPLITPEDDAVGVVVVGFDPGEHPSPDPTDEAGVLAIANLAAPILATLARSWTHEKAMEALRHLLHPDAVPQPPGLEVYARCEPAETPSGLGGDYYDAFQIDDALWGFVIGDVTGKGLEASRYTAMAKYVVRSFALEYRSAARTISQASKALAAQMDDLKFVTLFLALVDAKENTLTYCCAGHPPGLLYSHESDEFRELTTGGGMVGFAQLDGFEEETIALRPGDLLLLCTDGIAEARNGETMYGTEHLKPVIRANAARTLKNLACAVTDDVRAFSENMVRDDMALLLLRAQGAAEGTWGGS